MAFLPFVFLICILCIVFFGWEKGRAVIGALFALGVLWVIVPVFYGDFLLFIVLPLIILFVVGVLIYSAISSKIEAGKWSPEEKEARDAVGRAVKRCGGWLSAETDEFFVEYDKLDCWVERRKFAETYKRD